MVIIFLTFSFFGNPCFPIFFSPSSSASSFLFLLPFSTSSSSSSSPSSSSSFISFCPFCFSSVTYTGGLLLSLLGLVSLLSFLSSFAFLGILLSKLKLPFNPSPLSSLPLPLSLSLSLIHFYSFINLFSIALTTTNHSLHSLGLFPLSYFVGGSISFLSFLPLSAVFLLITRLIPYIARFTAPSIVLSTPFLPAHSHP